MAWRVFIFRPNLRHLGFNYYPVIARLERVIHASSLSALMNLEMDNRVHFTL